MKLQHAHLIRFTTSDFMEKTVDQFCTRVRELDASGVFALTVKQEYVLNVPLLRPSFVVKRLGTEKGNIGPVQIITSFTLDV